MKTLRELFFALSALLVAVSRGPAQDDPAAKPEDELRQRIRDAVQSATRRLRERIGKSLERELEDLETEKRAPPDAGSEPDIGKVVRAVSKESIRKIVTYLASDELEGRGSGYPGNTKATEYIAGIYKEAGLKPVGDEDARGRPTYFQHFRNRNGRRTRNTVALLEGGDPELKDEIIILGGHHDHLGRGSQVPPLQALGRATPDDDIWNGADDNASGSGTVVAIAKAFSESGIRLKRSLLFMTFSGEEWGLVGSRYYCSHPIFPLSKTVAMINLDMIGRNPDRPVDIKGLGTEAGDLFEQAVERAIDRTGLNARLQQSHRVGGGDSDHSSFIAKGVPAMFFFTGLHRDYHRPSDHVERLAFDRMERIARTIVYILWALGNSMERPAFAGRARFRFRKENPPGRGPRKLGIVPDSSFDSTDMDLLGLAGDEGGIQVSTVSPDSAAERAGIQVGDVIIRFDGKAFHRPVSRALRQLREWLAEVKPGREVEVVVIRGGERKVLKASWPE